MQSSASTELKFRIKDNIIRIPKKKEYEYRI